MLSALGDGADGGLEIEFSGVNLHFFAGMNGAKSRDGVCGVGDAKLAAQRGGGNACVMTGDVEHFDIEHSRIGHGAQQVADKTIEFGIGDQMSGLLIAKRTAEDARKTEQS